VRSRLLDAVVPVLAAHLGELPERLRGDPVLRAEQLLFQALAREIRSFL
jgi:hypothetical protein